MYSLSIVIAEHDPAIAHALASSLDRHFRSVRLARSLEELKSAIPRHRIDAVVADLETVALNDITEISRDLHLPVICTHRVPDEAMWTAALNAGALDVCSNEPGAVVAAVRKHFQEPRISAA
jgi:DNA-binding NtrC family response regulator